MAKLIGPLGSGLASGKINQSLIYSSNRGRPYTKRHRVPHNPRTQLQTGLRSAIPFISAQWQTLDATQEESWAELAEEFNLPNYHAYLKANLGLWPKFIAPIKHADNPGTDTSGTLDSITITYETNLVLIRAQMTPAEDCWGVIFCMDYPTYATPQVNRTVGISALDQYDRAYHVHRNMAPGTYYYSFAHFTHRGTLTSSTKGRRIIPPT